MDIVWRESVVEANRTLAATRIAERAGVLRQTGCIILAAAARTNPIV